MDENLEAAAVASIEHRLHERRGLRVHRLVRASIESDGQTNELYLYLVDISEGGIRINADNPFNLDQPFRLTFTLQYLDFDVTVRPVWQKSLAGGTWTCGLAYHEPTPQQLDQVRQMVEAFTAKGRRERFRLKALVSVALRADGESWFNILLVDISPKGLRGVWEGALDAEKTLDVRIIPPEMTEVEARARVVWQKEIGDLRHEFGLQFVEIEEQAAADIQSFIDRSVGLAS